MKPAVATVSLALLETNPTLFGQQVRAAMEENGFIAVINHGVNGHFLGTCFDVISNLLRSPREDLMKYAVKSRQRGYCPNGSEQAVGANAPDHKVFWMIRDPEMPTKTTDAPFGNNIWPKTSDYPLFQTCMESLLNRQLAIGRAVLRGIELGYGLPNGFLTGMTVGAESILRPLYYPPIRGEVPPGTMRSAAHEDINLITVLFTERNAHGADPAPDGLELLLRDRWTPVKVDPQACVVNIGEMIAAINGLTHLRPTTHRVIMPTGEAALEPRRSTPLFMHARRSVELAPGLTAGAWIDERLGVITKAN